MKKELKLLKKPLHLSSEKIRELSASELTVAAGGSSNNGCTFTGSAGAATICHACFF